MLDGVNSGVPAFFNPGGEQANKFEQVADKLLWAPRQVLGNRTVKVVQDEHGVHPETHRDTATSIVKMLVKAHEIPVPVKVLITGGYGLLCVLTSPILLVSGLIGGVAKAIALATSSESKLRMKIVQTHLKAEGRREKLANAQARLAATLNEKIPEFNEKRPAGQERLRENYGEFYAQGFVDLANGKGDNMEEGLDLVREIDGVSAEIAEVEALGRNIDATLKKTEEARTDALKALAAAYYDASTKKH